MKTSKHLISSFSVTFLAVLGACLLEIWLEKTFALENPFLVFVSAVVIASLYGGFFQGLLSTALSIMAIDRYFLLGGGGGIVESKPDIARLALFLLDAFLVSAIGGLVRRSSRRSARMLAEVREAEREAKESRIRLQKAHEELEIHVDERTKALKESERFLDSVVENIPNMIFVKDAADLKFIRFNRAGEELLGFSKAELLGKGDADFFPADQAESFIRFDRKVLEEGHVVDIPEEPIRTKAGVRYLHTKKIPVLDESGRPRYLLGISEDITERKALEQDKMRLLQEQAARLGAEQNAKRLEFLAEAGAALNESLEMRLSLEAFCKVVVRTFADCCLIDLLTEDGVDFQKSIFHHRDPAMLALVREFRLKYPLKWSQSRGVVRVVRTGQAELVRDYPVERVRQIVESESDRKRMRLEQIQSMIIVPLKYYGRTLGALTFISYDTQRPYDEIDLSIAFDLAKRVSVAVENARLYASAENANRAKSAFLANMSHEIRTPLGAMLGFAELVGEGDLSEDQKNGLATITRNGRQLLKIVDEILDLSKVESERIQIEEMPFDLRALLREVLGLLEVSAREKGLTLTMETAPDLPREVCGDPTRLRQILINIIGNAIKFTAAGFVRVSVKTTMPTMRADRCVLEVSVVDTGIGLSGEQASRLFQPFAQADDSMTRRFGGTGLGLFLSRRLARLLGGDLVLEWSHPGEGSHFIVTVELRLLAATKSASAPPTASAGTDSVSHAARILVVDDAPDNRVLIGRYLKKSGYQVETAENGEEGVRKAGETPYDLILMDIQMPEMDGFEAIRLLRERHDSRPVIALTAHAMKGDRELCLSHGFTDYLSKPIDRDRLLKAIQQHLQKA